MTRVPTAARKPQDQAERPREINFFAELPRAFAYPFHGRGKWIVLAGGGAFWFLGVLQDVLGGVGRAVVVMAMAIGVLTCGYLFAYVFRVIASSADGEAEPPDWPDVLGAGGDFFDEMGRPILLVLGTVVMSFLPLLIYVLAAAAAQGRIGDIAYYDFTGMFAPGWAWPWCRNMRTSLYYFGLAYLPMAMLAMVLFDSVRAAHVGRVLAAIAKAPAHYLIVLAVLMGAAWALPKLKALTAMVPVAGALADWVIGLYLYLFIPRLIGLLYAANRRRLNWFGE